MKGEWRKGRDVRQGEWTEDEEGGNRKKETEWGGQDDGMEGDETGKAKVRG